VVCEATGWSVVYRVVSCVYRVVCCLRRDMFYELVREFEDSHLSAGWSVRQHQSDRIHRLISIGRDSAAAAVNSFHLARLLVLQLIQVSHCFDCRHWLKAMTKI